ncbi:MAG: hypothetical protein GY870_09225 [archaeon]|nr:hypothetical protein [archaeon]
MKKHEITFLRSGSSEHELVLSHKVGDKFIDYVFDGECSDSDLRYKTYSISEVK